MNELFVEIKKALQPYKEDLKPLWRWFENNWDRFIHLVWATIFAIVGSKTGTELWFWIGAGPALLYSLFWMFFLGKYFERKRNAA